MKAPLVSVLVPTYNYAQFLPEAIDSVLAQDCNDFELLICDDDSTDDSAEVLQTFAARDPRIRVAVQAANIGMVNNWNHCLKLARGEYVKFLFGDDKLAHPQALGKLVGLLEANPGATLAAAGRMVMDENSRLIDVWQSFSEGRQPGRETIIRCLIEHANLIGEPSATLFRKKDAERGFNRAYRQFVDLDLWFYLLEKGDLVYTREPLCAFRQHRSQQTARNEADGSALTERLLFFANSAQPWAPRRALFSTVYAFRRFARRNQLPGAEPLREAQRNVSRRLGQGWYWLYWAQHRVTAPFRNLARSRNKRAARRLLAGP
jgi:glycosyltransferase involved in cell wall biosynthesis